MFAWGRDLPGSFFRFEKIAYAGRSGCVPCEARCQPLVGLFGQTVDPAFCLLLKRIRLFRLMWRDFPQAHRRMQRGLVSLRCGNGGVSYLLAKQLRSLEWLPLGLEVQDDVGRSFHLVEMPLNAVRRFWSRHDGPGGQEYVPQVLRRGLPD